MALRLLSRCRTQCTWGRTPCRTVVPHCHPQQRRRSMTSLKVAPASSQSAVPAEPSGQPAEAQPTVTPAPRTSIMPWLQSKYCRMCGGSMRVIQPEGDKEWRHVCNDCDYIDYFNPRMVVGCVVEHDGKILLCKRAIEPCKGLWTIPAGFMEIGESSAAGAARETYEEAFARVHVLSQYAHWDIPAIGQAYILFKAKLAAPYTYSSGPESLEVELFEPENIPFDQIAFSSVSITLRHYLQDMSSGVWHLHHGVIDKTPGAAPNDPAAFQLRDHFAVPVTLGRHSEQQQ